MIGAISPEYIGSFHSSELEVGRYPLCQYRYDIDMSDPKYRQYRYPLLQRSLAYSHILLSATK